MPDPNGHKRLAERITESGNEFGRIDRLREARGQEPVYYLDAQACLNAAALIQKLDTEVYRLRQAIGCYANGVMSLAEMQTVARTWNGGVSAS